MHAKIARTAIATLSLMALAVTFAQPKPHLELAFHRMYELKFDEARAEIAAYQREQPEDPLGIAAEAASYLFDQFDRKGVLTSAFFLDDRKLLGGAEGPPDERLSAAFLKSNQAARNMAQKILRVRPRDAEALFVFTLTEGMESDFKGLIEKHQLASLTSARRAEKDAARLLEIDPNACDAFLAIGAANYIIGCLPAYERAVLWLGGFRGDRQRGMVQLEKAATGGHYLRPLAKVFLALAAERERQFERARILFADLHNEFPQNPVFERELALAAKAEAEASRSGIDRRSASRLAEER